MFTNGHYVAMDAGEQLFHRRSAPYFTISGTEGQQEMIPLLMVTS